jgi:hypothetical protein
MRPVPPITTIFTIDSLIFRSLPVLPAKTEHPGVL